MWFWRRARLGSTPELWPLVALQAFEPLLPLHVGRAAHAGELRLYLVQVSGAKLHCELKHRRTG